jgi:hypothetical protein
MDDRVETFKVLPDQVAEIFANFRNFRGRRPEIAAGKEIGVQAADLVASRG